MQEILVLRTCECGCGELTTIYRRKPRRYINTHHLKGETNPFYGKCHLEETKRKLSEINSNPSEETRRKMSEHNIMSNKEWVKENFTGVNNPNYGRKLTKEHKMAVSIAHKGNAIPDKTKQKMSDAHSGDKNPMYGKSGVLSPTWRGGLSFEPYGIEFNQELKSQIRDRDNHICQLCNIIENGRLLDIHHIDYNKQNNNPLNLVSLCKSCHTITGGNREIWQEVFSDFEIKELT